MVGIVIPLRGVATTSFHCDFSPVRPDTVTQERATVAVTSVTNIPHIVLLKPDSKTDTDGVLLSGLFTLQIVNLEARTVTVEVQLNIPQHSAIDNRFIKLYYFLLLKDI